MGSVAGDREVAVVHLIDDEVCRRMSGEAMVVGPAIGVGLLEVDDGPTLAVDTNGLGKDTRRVAEPDVKGIELPFQVAFDGGRPAVLAIGAHLHRTQGLTAEAIAPQRKRGTLGTIEKKNSLLGTVRHLAKDILRPGRHICCQHCNYSDG